MIAPLQEQVGQNHGLWQGQASAYSCLAKLLKDQEAVLQRLNSLAATVKGLTAQLKKKR